MTREDSPQRGAALVVSGLSLKAVGARLRNEIVAYYSGGSEAERLEVGYFRLERLRTLALLAAALPPPPARVLDIGGGTGPYARALTASGYEVHLLDPMPIHVEIAARPGPEGPPPRSAVLGDARELPWSDAEADAVLLLGPLYHLPERVDRARALTEAYRVLRPGGTLVAAGISRLSPLLDGIFGAPTGRPQEPLALRQGLEVLITALRTGRYSNPTADPNMFTTAYMHTSGGLAAEIDDAGFDCDRLSAVEGPGAWLPGFDRLFSRARGRSLLSGWANLASRRPWLRSLTPHLLASATKRSDPDPVSL